MASYKGSSIFPRNPYHIPGYGGYVPQFTFRFGNTYGRTTHDVLMDPTVSKSHRSVLAPLDNKENLLELHYHIEHPGYVTFQPINSLPEVPLGPQPVVTPAPEEPMMAHMDPTHWRSPPDTAAPGARQTWLPPGPLRGTAPPPPREGGTAVTHLPHGETSEVLPSVSSSFGMENIPAPLPAWAFLWDVVILWMPLCARGHWEGFRNHLGSLQLWGQAPEGYTGFIPCATDNIGMNYILSVKKAMKEFDRRQLLERNPPYTLGTRFPRTHWPDTKIYTRAGLKPFYLGFVPRKFITPAVPDSKAVPGNFFTPHTTRRTATVPVTQQGTSWLRAGEKGVAMDRVAVLVPSALFFSADLRDIYGLTYGDGTREAYRCEQRRRGLAL
ncbi:PREDICTED: protein FAM166A [Corvus brachyrhynchos]|uniref:protein FAM166A n=1 Tax=Corvus brachyrhynchos TaxID=85066 RepID=UPI0008164F52|nr:PREDICTED: protein FAM166A [Corvus brachyrhynchos]